MTDYRFYKTRLWTTDHAIWRYLGDAPVGEIQTTPGGVWRTAIMPQDLWYENELIEFPEDEWSE